ncbi:MAG: prepilin-type N-terminal cleavage/methylation domain-containing protein [Phycisphaeraceae bacterium]|nr:prepilin-type N-terminal cleavage/methylation domain-containing protein [Phycisphaeraceae bacterium]
MMKTNKAFTLIELLVVISIIALLIGILLPALGAARRTARQMQNSTQIRGIHTALVLFSQGNNTYYPGLTTKGKILAAAAIYAAGDQNTTADETGAAVGLRFRELLEDNYFTGEYAVSPSETKTRWAGSGNEVTALNLSYAMLQITTTGKRDNEWRDTSNSEAVVLSDRAKTHATGKVKSVHTNPSGTTNEWRGSVGFNDNHVTFEATHDQLNLQYGDSSITADNLFDNSDANTLSVTSNDAPMVFDGTSSMIE